MARSIINMNKDSDSFHIGSWPAFKLNTINTYHLMVHTPATKLVGNIIKFLHFIVVSVVVAFPSGLVEVAIDNLESDD